MEADSGLLPGDKSLPVRLVVDNGMTDSTTDGDVLTNDRGLFPLLPRLRSPSLELKDELMAAPVCPSCNFLVCFFKSKLRQNPFPQIRQVNCFAIKWLVSCWWNCEKRERGRNLPVSCRCACACGMWGCRPGGRPCCRRRTCRPFRRCASVCGSCSCPSGGSPCRSARRRTAWIRRGCGRACWGWTSGWTLCRKWSICAASRPCGWSCGGTRSTPAGIPCRRLCRRTDGRPCAPACGASNCNARWRSYRSPGTWRRGLCCPARPYRSNRRMKTLLSSPFRQFRFLCSCRPTCDAFSSCCCCCWRDDGHWPDSHPPHLRCCSLDSLHLHPRPLPHRPIRLHPNLHRLPLRPLLHRFLHHLLLPVSPPANSVASL